MALLTLMKEGIHALPRNARVGIAVGAVLIALCTAWALWLVFSPREEVLFSQLAESDAAEIAATLTEWKVPYTLTDNGSTVLVNAEQMLQTRMRLVSSGVPKGGHVGYELFDDNEFGVTEFAQRINYQRALQGELERTIASIPGVRDVRVHLSIRRAGAFLGEDASSKASVALTLEPGTTLARRQVAGIRNLVASAVEGLDPAAVVVVGPAGLQLGAGATAGTSAEADDTAAELGARIESRLTGLLAEALNGQRASVSVDVRMNYDSVRRTSETPVTVAGQDHGVVVRRTRNGTPTGDATAAAGLQNEQVEYAHGMAREEVTRAVGVVERITVAVVLPAGVDEAEQVRLTRLATAAAGLDPGRGDRIEVSTAAVIAPATGSDVTASRQAPVQPPVAASQAWRALAWSAAVLIAFVIGMLLGVWGVRRRNRAPQLLSREESERAAQQVRAWLSDGARS